MKSDPPPYLFPIRTQPWLKGIMSKRRSRPTFAIMILMLWHRHGHTVLSHRNMGQLPKEAVVQAANAQETHRPSLHSGPGETTVSRCNMGKNMGRPKSHVSCTPAGGQRTVVGPDSK